ncbi:MAG: hypothetical protein AAFR67_11875, partial [Chloroflexota bacterium]
MAFYLKHEHLQQLGSGTLNITGTGYSVSFGRGRIFLPKFVVHILRLLYPEVQQMSDMTVLQLSRIELQDPEQHITAERLRVAVQDESFAVRKMAIERLSQLTIPLA